MKRPARRQASPGKVAFAVAALLLGVWVAFSGIAGSLGPTPGPIDSTQADPDEDGDATDEPIGRRGARLGDLLLVVGSYRAGDELGKGYRAVEAAVVATPQAVPPAAPAGEVVSIAAPRPAEPPRAVPGFEPKPMNVTFVMVGGELSRACVDGVIVGVGAKVAAGVITAIRHEGVEVRSGTLTLFYDLDGPLPREYRAEAARRAAAPENPQEEAK